MPVAVLERPKRKSTGRPCSVCTHAEVKTINRAISAYESFRSIALRYGMSNVSVHRHTENCLHLEIQALKQENKIENAIDYYNERAEAFRLLKRMVFACSEWLTDPDNPERFTLAPRSDELTVVIDDYNKMFMGKPTRSKVNLDELLDGIYADADVKGVRVINNQADNRKVFLDTMKDINVKLDAIAKTEGIYTKERENPHTLDKTIEEARMIRSIIECPPEDLPKLLTDLLESVVAKRGHDLAVVRREAGFDDVGLIG